MNTDDARTVPDVPRLRRSLLGWYRREARDLPWRRTRDPYAVWISEVMLQQTTVATVIPYYERFLSRFPDLASLAASDEEELLGLWSGLGYYRRARNLRAAARIIMERHGGRFPEDPAAIEELPGIGRYTAGAIASNCFGMALPAIDTNAARVLARVYAVAEPAAATSGVRPGRADRPDGGDRADRLGHAGRADQPGQAGGADRPNHADRRGADRQGHTDRPDRPDRQGGRLRRGRASPVTNGDGRVESRTAAIWRIAETLVPPDSPGDWTQALMELGATVCRPATPDCGICPVAEECVAFARGDLAPYSLARPRTSAVTVHASLVVVARGEGEARRILFVRRSAGELLGGLWELPGTLAGALASSARPTAAAEAAAERPASIARALELALQFAPTGLSRVAEIRHAVTHRRLRIAVWTARAAQTASLPKPLRPLRAKAHLWVSPRMLTKLPIGAASRKALAAALRAQAASPSPVTRPRTRVRKTASR